MPGVEHIGAGIEVAGEGKRLRLSRLQQARRWPAVRLDCAGRLGIESCHMLHNVEWFYP
jgi:hypothetical protein